MEIFTGVPVSPGVAIGPVFLLETEERSVPERPVAALSSRARADG